MRTLRPERLHLTLVECLSLARLLWWSGHFRNDAQVTLPVQQVSPQQNIEGRPAL